MSQQPTQKSVHKPTVVIIGVVFVALIVYVAIALTGSGHSQSNASAAPVTTSGTDAAPAGDHSPEDQAFLSTLRDRDLPGIDRASDELIDVAHKACTAIDAGNSPVQLAMSAQHTINGSGSGMHWTSTDAGHLIGAAIGAYCPEHLDNAQSN